MREQSIVRLMTKHRAESLVCPAERPVRERVRAAMAGWRPGYVGA